MDKLHASKRAIMAPDTIVAAIKVPIFWTSLILIPVL